MLDFTLPSLFHDTGLLLIRLLIGFAFLASSANKAKNLPKFAKQNGLPLPVATIVTICEFAGGLALLLGILPKLAALGIMALMLNTILLHITKWKSPYWASKGGWEYDLMLFALASVILLDGAGKFSVF
jgi:putative oxidoreductase